MIQAWDFASQTNNDHLASAVSSILALLLKTLSPLLELRDQGRALCRTLLHTHQARHIQNSLRAPKHKEHLISPCLRILTEIVSFDGGAVAAQLYAKQQWTFDTGVLVRNLGLQRTSSEEDRRKPSVRSNTVRYLLASLKFHNEECKKQILREGRLFRALFDHLKDDSLEIVHDVLSTVDTHVLRAEGVPRKLRTSVLSRHTLTGILNVAREADGNTIDQGTSEQGDKQPESQKRKAAALAFLRRVCMTQSLGVLQPNGWYPTSNDKKPSYDDNDEDEVNDLSGQDAAIWLDRYTHGVPIHNPILSEFLQVLRPHSNLEERSLMLDIFRATPELVADYLLQKKDKLSLEPKLTNTWIGYASLFYSIVDLPVPAFFGSESHYSSTPPPMSVCMENILPSPLSQKTMTRCLNQASDLITLFAVRILVISFQKLNRVLDMFQQASSRKEDLWQEGAGLVLSEFSQRCPSIKDVITVFRKADTPVLKEAVAHLLQLYYATLNHTDLDNTFDVSTALTGALSTAESKGSNNDAVSDLEVQHLAVLAGQSTGMRWWHKQGQLQYSPFVTLLRLTASRSVSGSGELSNLLASVASNEGVLRQGLPATQALIASLIGWEPSEGTMNFIEDCLGRLAKKPIKYQDDLDKLLSASHATQPVSMILMVCLEQAPFTSRLAPSERDGVLSWMARLFALLGLVGEDQDVLKAVSEGITQHNLVLPVIPISVLTAALESIKIEQKATQSHAVESRPKGDQTSPKRVVNLSKALMETDNHPELQRWQQKEVEEVIETELAEKLILCVCSKYPEIRLQGLNALRRITKTCQVSASPEIQWRLNAHCALQESNYEEKDQVSLLLAELIETAQGVTQAKALPYVAGAYAVHALRVQTDPSHFMYPKVNKFQTRKPAWRVNKLPEYWLDKVLLEVPEEDDAHWREVDWVLDMLVDGLRTAEV